MEINEITGQIVDAAMKVHTKLGPGLLESAYEACLAYELRQRGLQADTQVSLPISYEDVQLDAGYRIDLLVESQVIVELKALRQLTNSEKAQVINYLKGTGHERALLINFGSTSLQYKRFVLSKK